jgi:hypothetical protein
MGLITLGKGKVVFVLNKLSTMPWRHVGVWRYRSTILDLGTRWRWVVIFTHRPLYLRGKSPGTHWVEGWVGRRAGLDAVENRTILTWAVRPVACRYTDWAIPTPNTALDELVFPACDTCSYMDTAQVPHKHHETSHTSQSTTRNRLMLSPTVFCSSSNMQIKLTYVFHSFLHSFICYFSFLVRSYFYSY